ncbi:hypothetical protein LTR17_013895 [Elasticomyces elasticus]|nr:hypothetical protein LTR17_013895 [Elasticomyces elasticus]
MRLLKLGPSGALEFVECFPGSIPHYAILSHTWGEDKDEVTFNDLENETGKDKAGYAKIDFCRQQAKKDGLDHFWVDTCSDVPGKKRDHQGQTQGLWEDAFRRSRYFTRGWTLQELLAPKSVDFFSWDGCLLGSKEALTPLIESVTGIPAAALRGEPLSSFTVDRRMQWAEKRITTKEEDKWYSLLGLFDVNMSLIYGEGERAACRLKDEIAKSLRERMDTSKRYYGTSDPRSSAVDRRDRLLASLAFEQMDVRRATIKLAYPETCRWFVSHPAYLAWLDHNQLDQHHGFLWIKGKPGAGKSTLMKFAHAHARAHAHKNADENELLVSFFFNARGEELESSVVGMYRSLLFQLLQKAPDLRNVLGEIENLKNDHGTLWTIASLRELFVSAVRGLNNRRLKCFIDALDECDEEQVQDMVDCFEEFGQHVLEEGDGRHIHICFASRHYPAVHVQHGLQMTLEGQEGHSDDLAKYVQKRLRAGKGKNIEGVRSQICEKANGVFLWVVLVVEILNKEFVAGRMFALKKRLHEIPPKLSDLFKDILRRDIVNMDDLLLCLQWVVFAKRPLTREEYYYAMLAGLDPGPESLSEWDPEQVTTDDMDRYVLSSSKGLAELTKSKAPTVQFIHESVRDFLVKDGGMHELWPNLGSNVQGLAHDRLKCCCESYIAIKSSPYGSLREKQFERQFKASSESAKMFRANLARRYPFLEYAAQHLLHHADEAALATSQNAFLKCIDLDALIELKNVFERYEKRCYTTKANLPYLLAEGGHARLMRTAREDGVSFHTRGERYQFPLFAAIACGHRDAVGVILESEDFTNIPDLTQHMKFGRDTLASRSLTSYTPLMWAIEEGHEAVAERLTCLAEECDIIAQNRDGRSALSLAAEKGYVAMLGLLVARNGNVNIADNKGKSPLSYAVEHSRSGTVQWLLEHDARVGTWAVSSDLALAAQNDDEAMVRLLLEYGATIEGSRALHVSVSERMVELLLDVGADANEVYKYFGSPIYSAARRGRKAIVRLLIKNLANVNLMSPMGSALWGASSVGSEGTVRLLLENSADVNAYTEHHGTALKVASEHGHVGIVSLLLDHGADVNIGSCGFSALQMACATGHEAIVRALLAHVGNEERNRGYIEELRLAGNHGFIVQLLLDDIAGVNDKVTEHAITVPDH